MKSLSFAVALVLCSFLVKHEGSADVVLTAWPQGTHFYRGEPIALTCGVKGNFSNMWIFTWFGHNLSKTAAPIQDHRVNNYSYSTSALTAEDSGTYWCMALDKDTNNTLRSNNVSLTITTEVHPNSSQHQKGGMFSLRCSDRSRELIRLRGTGVVTGCSQMEGRDNMKSPGECIFSSVSSRMSGLYWCRSAGRDQRSKAISITVSDNADAHSEEEDSSGPWLEVLCATLVILLLIPLVLLLVPSIRQRIKFFPTKAPRVVSAQQEMPQTKQDVTEIQWDLAWMEMANLLDKQQYPGS
ncbi:uncharacterized protein LOC143521707 isoform X2 [Brachyhypopomus gauderio]|uniref:uncharacterized protein LOC143521707 isoform X2 n=1 Tax=Brachyhypopomus gauderio TaxID=698409 RepID=UPI004042C243